MIASIIDQFKAARRVSVPIVAVTTMDQQATVRSLAELINGDTPVLVWDMARGIARISESEPEGWPAELYGAATIGTPTG